MMFKNSFTFVYCSIEFWELGTTVGLGLEYGDVPCGGTVCGIGTINGTQVF